MRGFHPVQLLLAYISGGPDAALAKAHAVIDFQQAQLEILRRRLEQRTVRLKPEEKALLVRLARPLGGLLSKFCILVHADTLKKWIRQADGGLVFKRSRLGRPPTAEGLIRLVVRMARENVGWGVPRIFAEMRKLGLRIGLSTIRYWLRRHGIEPAPDRRRMRWRDFIEGTLATLWAADFMEIKSLTLKGVVTWYALVFIHIESRRLWIAGATQRPDAAWVEEQGERFQAMLVGRGEKAGWIILDRDTKYTKRFKDGLKAHGTKVKQTLLRAPKMNSHCERVIQTVRHECTDHFAIFGHRHLMFLLKCFERYYNGVRPHKAMGGVPLNPKHRGPVDLSRDPPSNVIRVKFLGGLHSHYVRQDQKAA